jgi:hypothetical protein
MQDETIELKKELMKRLAYITGRRTDPPSGGQSWIRSSVNHVNYKHGNTIAAR